MPPQSLADYLGLTSGTTPTQAAAQVDDYTTLSGEDFAKRIVGSTEFRQYLLNGITLNTLPKEVIVRLLDHAWGKPVDTLKVDQRSATVTFDAQLTGAELAERARKLADLIGAAAAMQQPPA